MNQILSVFGYGMVHDCEVLHQALKKQGISRGDFLEFVEKSKVGLNGSSKEPVKKQVPIRQAPKKYIFLKTGEIELMKGVLCEKCKGKVYIEGICPSNPLVQQGFVRRGICGECGTEFGIR